MPAVPADVVKVLQYNFFMICVRLPAHAELLIFSNHQYFLSICKGAPFAHHQRLFGRVSI